MKEGLYLKRLEALEKAFSDNSLTLGRQLAQMFARLAAHEELFVTGPQDAGFFKSRWLIFRNRLLTVFAPGIAGSLITERENEIREELKEIAEQRFIDDAMKKMKKAPQPAEAAKVERVEEPNKMKTTLKVLTLIIAVALCSSGCALKSQLAKAHDEGFGQANAQCMELQGRVQGYITGLQVKFAQFEERLKMLNQLTPDGELRYGQKTKPAATPVPTVSPVAPK